MFSYRFSYCWPAQSLTIQPTLVSPPSFTRLDSPFIQPALAALHSFGLLLRFPRASFFFAACPLSLAISPIDHPSPEHPLLCFLSSSLLLLFSASSWELASSPVRVASSNTSAGPPRPAAVRLSNHLTSLIIYHEYRPSLSSPPRFRLLHPPTRATTINDPILTTAPWSRPLADGSMPPPPPHPYITSA